MKNRKLLMIPGPIEFEPSVLQAMGMPTNSHVAPEFIDTFGKALERMREVWLCPSGQPFIMAGSGTLAMDMAGCNLVEPGDKALVISTGYFGARYAALLERYGAKVMVLESDIGNVVAMEEVEKELKSDQYKLLCFTHVDTSTAVRVDPQPIGELGKKYGVLTILDGVCSVAGEVIRQEDWGIDVVLTASQKAIGVPPGLALMVASAKAMETWKKRVKKVGNYYADWEHWLPIMEAYEARKPSYFGTPAVNLVEALNISLGNILKEGMEARFKRHQKMAEAIRAGLKALGLSHVPVNDDIAANTLSAPKYPKDVTGSELLGFISKAGAILAGGLHPANKNEYFRIGHMGSVSKNDVLATLGAIESGLQSCGYGFQVGASLKAASQF